jgi:transcriptional regulator with XRE-family HTH domain
VASSWAMPEATDIDVALGRVVAGKRVERSMSQIEMADLMIERGLAWTQSTVSQTEQGRRTLSLIEAVALADVFELPLSLLLEVDRVDQFVKVGEGTWVGEFVRRAADASTLVMPDRAWYTSPALEEKNERERRMAKLVGSRRDEWSEERHWFVMRWDLEDASHAAVSSLLRAGKEERKIAERIDTKTHLGTTRADVAAGSLRLWGNSFVGERDRRVLADHRTRGASDRSVGVLRGHISREMIKELAGEMERAADRAEKKSTGGSPIAG